MEAERERAFGCPRTLCGVPPVLEREPKERPLRLTSVPYIALRGTLGSWRCRSFDFFFKNGDTLRRVRGQSSARSRSASTLPLHVRTWQGERPPLPRQQGQTKSLQR